MMTPRNYRPLVFVSYARKDAQLLDSLAVRLDELAERGAIKLFIDTGLEAGDVWLRNIRRSLHNTDVAVLLVSQNFLNSEFISRIELPAIRKAARNRNSKVIPIFLEECDVSEQEWILDHQSPTSLEASLATLNDEAQSNLFDKVSDLIKIFAYSDTRLKRFLRRKVLNWRFSIPFALVSIFVATSIFFLGWRLLQPLQVQAIAWSVPTSLCKAEVRGTAIQLFEKGWLVSRFETGERIAVIKRGTGEVAWRKVPSAGFTKGVKVACEGVERENLVQLGFRWWYCSEGEEELRRELGPPLAKETRAWLEYQDWAEGQFIYGLPATLQGIETKHFQILTGVMLENYEMSKGAGRMFSYSNANPSPSAYCTAKWYPAQANLQRTEMHANIAKGKDCPNAVDAEYYIRPRPTCSLSGY